VYISEYFYAFVKKFPFITSEGEAFGLGSGKEKR
jgi:hypothetical protein